MFSHEVYMYPLWRSKLGQKFNFSVSVEKKRFDIFVEDCYRNVWASGGVAVGFSKRCSLTDSTVFFWSWSLTVFSPYPTQTSAFSSPKVYTRSLQTKELYTCLLLLSLLFHCLAKSWLSFSLATLPTYPFLLWNSFSSHINVIFFTGYKKVDQNSMLIWNQLFSNVFATIPVDLGRLSHVLPNSCLSLF